MAELIGLTASIIAIIQLTGKISALSYEYIGAAVRAPKDLRNLVEELGALGKVIHALLDLADENPDSQVLRLLCSPGEQNGGVLQLCATELNQLYEELKQFQKKGNMGRLKWVLKEKDTNKYISQLERYKALFSLALTADHTYYPAANTPHASI